MDIIENEFRVYTTHTRRKACYSCMKAKRRCDLILPKCTRCLTRGLECLHGEASDSVRKLDKPMRTQLASNNSTHSRRNSASQIVQLKQIEDRDTPFDPFFFPEVQSLTKSQIHYSVSHLKGWIGTFVRECQTPFIHLRSYQNNPPPAYEDALSICSLYLHRTPQNQTVMFSLLESKLSALIQESTLWFTADDYLLGLQLLIIYQIIGLFDGDMKLRANAERSLPLLDSWTFQLHQRYFDIEMRCLSGSEAENSWIMLESVRRTILVAVLLQGIFSVMKEGICKLIPLLATLPVSINGTSWTDPAEKSFNTQQLITYHEFTLAWNDGTIDRVEEYEKMLLVVCRVAKGTSHFLV